MTELTWSDVQELADYPRRNGMVVSCYADLSVQRGFESDALVQLKTQAGEVKATLVNAAEREEFERNVGEIRRALEEAPKGVRGMAVFSAATQEWARSFALDFPIQSRLVVNGEPYLVPLLQAMCQHREYLVVLTNTHRGRLYAGTAGRARLLGEIEEEVPKRQHSAGQRWGTQQATIARHREEHILHFQKELVRAVERAWSERTYQGIILLGEHAVLEHFRKQLPARFAAQVLHEAPQGWTDSESEILAAVSPAATALLAEEEQRLLEDFRGRLAERYAVALGPAEVLAALQGGKIGPRGVGRLLLGPDPGETVARCTACRRLYTEMPTVCPKCQAECVVRNLWEETLLLALRHEVAVHSVADPEVLDSYEGMAALLARPQPAAQPTTA